MISGLASKIENLTGTITAKKSLEASLNAEKGLIGKVSLSVKDVPYFETSNSAGGITVYIGKEIVNNGV